MISVSVVMHAYCLLGNRRARTDRQFGRVGSGRLQAVRKDSATARRDSHSAQLTAGGPSWQTERCPMRIAKNDIPVKFDVPGAVTRQADGFGDPSASGSFSGEYFSLASGTDIAPLLAGLEGNAC